MLAKLNGSMVAKQRLVAMGARISGFSNVGACPRFREFIFLLSSEAFGLFRLTSFFGHEHSTSPRVMFRILITSRPTIQPDLLTNAGNLW